VNRASGIWHLASDIGKTKFFRRVFFFNISPSPIIYFSIDRFKRARAIARGVVTIKKSYFMKKLFGMAGLVLFFGTTMSVNAQSNRVNSSETPAQPETNITSTTVSAKVERAERDFSKSYKNASNIQWHETYDGGSVVDFTESDIKMKSVYNKKGNWIYTLRFYTENEMNKNEKSMIKNAYCNYTILHAIEVERFDKKVLLVYMQNERSLKTARIMDGEIDIVEDFRKSK